MTAELLPAGSKVGDVLKVDADFNVDGIDIVAVAGGGRARKEANLLELIPSERPFEPVTQQLAKRDRSDDRRGDRRDRRPREDGDRRERRAPRDGAGDRGPRAPRGDRPAGDGERRDRGPRERRDQRPHFAPPPEMPQRPKPKRLKPGRAHRTEVLAGLSEDQRPIAELTLQGLAAVRQRLRDDNAKLKA